MTTITHFVASTGFDAVRDGERVIVLLHGYGSDDEDLPGLTRYLPGDRPWVSPRGPIALDHGGFAWAPLTVPGNPDPDDIETATAELWSWLDATIPATSPLIVIGFSQGGLMTSQLLRTRPDRIAGAAVLSGFVLNAPQPADDALAGNSMRLFYCRGLNDTVIAPDAVERALAWFRTHGDTAIHEYPGLAHSIDQRVLADLVDYLVSLDA